MARLGRMRVMVGVVAALLLAYWGGSAASALLLPDVAWADLGWTSRVVPVTLVAAALELTRDQVLAHRRRAVLHQRDEAHRAALVDTIYRGGASGAVEVYLPRKAAT